jgi:hypothetical protein
MTMPRPADPNDRARHTTRRLAALARVRVSVFGLALAASSALFACTTKYIPNTDVPDTEENRELIAFCEEYRRAVERKNIGALLKLASERYYEDGGNVDASDDIDLAGLEEYLSDRFQDASAIRYEIRYREISREEGRIYVDYTYSASFRIPGVSSEEWKRRVEDNRLEIVEEDGKLRIIAGM